MPNDLLALEDQLQELQLQLDFLLRAFAALSTGETDKGLQPSAAEAYHGLTLGQSLVQKMVDLATESATQHRQKL